MKQIFAARDKLRIACHPFVGQVLSGETFHQFVGAVHREIISCQYAAVFNSVRTLAGFELRQAGADELSWRLAGNLHRLRRGQPVPPWTAQTEPEWVTIQIASVLCRNRAYRAKSEDQAMRAGTDGMVRRLGVELSFVVLNGLPAGRVFERFWSLEYCESIKREFGFDSTNRERRSRVVLSRPSWPFLDAMEFYRMRCQIFLEPSLGRVEDVGFEKVRGTSGTKRWSRAIMSLRLRDGYACPKMFPDDFACHRCHVGMEHCRAACHPLTYVVGHCKVCNRRDRYFDPSGDMDACIACAED